jgi:hypothetical protein
VIFACLVQAASSLATDASALESSISALLSKIRELESSSVPWERALPWFTLLVAVGVAMELWVMRHERRDDMEAWRRGIVRPPDRPSTVKYLVEVASILLITAGIVGELWVGIKITSINGVLRSLNAEVRTKSDQLVELLHGEAEGLRKDAEIEHSARVKIEASVEWRHLTEQQQKGIGMDLGIKFSKSIIGIWFLAGDIEGSRFASDIAEAMRDAQLMVWPPKSLALMRVGGPLNSKIERDPTGISVAPTTTDPRSGSLAVAIRDELTSLGFDATLKPSSAKPDFTSPPEVTIIVESRPEGPQGKFKLDAEREAKTRNKAKKQ